LEEGANSKKGAARSIEPRPFNRKIAKTVVGKEVGQCPFVGGRRRDNVDPVHFTLKQSQKVSYASREEEDLRGNCRGRRERG